MLAHRQTESSEDFLLQISLAGFPELSSEWLQTLPEQERLFSSSKRCFCTPRNRVTSQTQLSTALFALELSFELPGRPRVAHSGGNLCTFPSAVATPLTWGHFYRLIDFHHGWRPLVTFTTQLAGTNPLLEINITLSLSYIN